MCSHTIDCSCDVCQPDCAYDSCSDYIPCLDGCLSDTPLSCTHYSGDDITLGSKNITQADTGDDAINKLAEYVKVISTPDDKFVKINSNDTTSGYLNDKLIGSDFISLSISNSSLNEKIKIDLKLTDLLGYVLSQVPIDRYVKISPTDTTSSYLISKIIQGEGIKIVKINSNSNEQLAFSVNISATAGNILSYNAGGLYVPTPPTFTETPLSIVDSSTVDLGTSGTSSHTLTASVKISGESGNILIDNLGLYVGVIDSSTVLLSIAGSGTNRRIAASAKISNVAGNILVDNSGLYVPSQGRTYTDTPTIDLTDTGTSVSGAVKISATGGNIITANSDGLFVPTPTVESTLTANDSPTIDFTQGGPHGHTITGEVKLSANSGNAISKQSDGLFVNSIDNTAFIQNQQSSEQVGVFRLRAGGGQAKLYWNGSRLIIQSDDPSNLYMGYDAFQGSGGSNNIGIGTASHVNGAGSNNIAIGIKSGWQHIGNNSTFIGLAAGYSTDGDNNTFIGFRSGSLTTAINSTLIGSNTTAGDLLASSGSMSNSNIIVEGGPATGTFTSNKIGGLSTFITTSGLSVGDTVSFHLTFSGTPPLSDNGLGRTAEFFEKGQIVNSSTIRLFMTPWADQGAGTFILEVYAPTQNTVVLGYNAHADKSNQVALGNSNITQLRSNTLKIKANATHSKGQILEYNGSEYVPSIITPQVLTYGATTTWNLDNGRNAKLTLLGNTTLAISNPIEGIYATIKIIQDVTGSRILTLPANSKVIGGGTGVITLTTDPNSVDILSFYYSDGNYYWTYGKNYN